MWDHLDTLFEGISATNLWDHKHGPDRTISDVPYHLAYCNHDLVITQSAQTIVKTTQGIQPLAEAMQNDVLRISAAEKLAACGERFPL